MGLFDFMNNDIGGYKGVVQAPATGNTGITYNDIASAALRYGSKPGSSGPMFGGMVNQPQQVGAVQQLNPNANNKKDSTGDILKLFLGFFGIGG